MQVHSVGGHRRRLPSFRCRVVLSSFLIPALFLSIYRSISAQTEVFSETFLPLVKPRLKEGSVDSFTKIIVWKLHAVNRSNTTEKLACTFLRLLKGRENYFSASIQHIMLHRVFADLAFAAFSSTHVNHTHNSVKRLQRLWSKFPQSCLMYTCTYFIFRLASLKVYLPFLQKTKILCWHHNNFWMSQVL